jgi:DUF4097 and DUF4098 domain-containing protein YvlB
MRRSAIVPLVVFLVVFATSLVSFAGEAEKMIEREFEIGAGKRLVLDIDTGGEIIVSGWGKDFVKVVVELDGKDCEYFEIDFDESSKGLEIETDYTKRKIKRCDVDIKVMVPDEFDVKVESMGGDLKIEGVEGEFKGKTMGGDIELIQLKGRVSLTTYGGEIDVIKSELDGKVKTMGGDILISEVKGDIKGSSMGGEVTYDKVSGGEDDEEVSVSTMGGDINLDYAGKHVKAKTFGGDVDVVRGKKVNVLTLGGDIDVAEAPMGAKVKTMGGDVHIKKAGVYVKASTMGGDIEIDAVDGWAEASTMGGDVTVEMVGDPDKGERHVELKSKGGTIELTVPEGLSMEFDIELVYTKDAKRTYKIVSDFSMEIEETKEWKRSWGTKKKYIYGTGSVGGGEHKITLKTVNGDIIIKKSK